MAYFGNNQRGELQELYADLNDLNFDKKKEVLEYSKVGNKKSDCLYDCRERCLTIILICNKMFGVLRH